MKHITRPLLPLCSLFFILASCSSEFDRHVLTPEINSIVLFADQTKDSLGFSTFDSWTVTPQADWIHIDGESHGEIKYDYMNNYFFNVMTKVEPNTTGKTRYGTVLVQSYVYSFSAPVIQLGLLQLSYPPFTTDVWLDEQSRIPSVAHYELTDSAHWISDSICFTVQNNWDLDFVGGTPDWIVLDKQTGLPGPNKVYLTLTPNADEHPERQATLKLTSGTVSNEIVVRQLSVKNEEGEI